MNNALPQSDKKLLTKFKKHVETSDFEDEVRAIRLEIGVPIDGLSLVEQEDKDHLWLSLYTPIALRQQYPEKIPKFLGTTVRAVKRLADKLAFSSMYFEQVITCYILYNQFFFDEILEQWPKLGLESLCKIVDAKMEIEEYISQEDAQTLATESHPEDDSLLTNMYTAMQHRSLDKYPLALRIHPEASKRDIVDYLNKHWGYIRMLQETYRVTSGTALRHAKTSRNEKIDKRNEFIYEQRDLPRREINKLLIAEGFSSMDVGSIGKIISNIKKEREHK
jgi:hypothetical protein